MNPAGVLPGRPRPFNGRTLARALVDERLRERYGLEPQREPLVFCEAFTILGFDRCDQFALPGTDRCRLHTGRR